MSMDGAQSETGCVEAQVRTMTEMLLEKCKKRLNGRSIEHGISDRLKAKHGL